MRGRLGIEVRLERGLQALIGRFVRTPGALRRHGARLQLADDLLQHLGMRAGSIGVQPFERQAAGLGALVMARDAVLIENGAA